MATLAGNSIASSYTSLLKLDGNTDSTVDGNNSNAIQVKTGDNDATPLFLNTDRLGVGGQPSVPLHIVADSVAEQLRIESSSSTSTKIYIRNDDTGNTGDALIRFGVNAQDWSIGCDNSASDAFVIGSAALLETDPHLTIATNGNATFSDKIGIGVTPIGTLDVNISTNARGSFGDSIGEIGSGVFALQVTNAAGDTLKPMGIRAEDIRLVTGSAIRFKLDDNSRISLSNNDNGNNNNTIFGKNAGLSIDDGSQYNTFIGDGVSDASMNNAISNVGLGFNALTSLTSGDQNLALGTQALNDVNTGSDNVAIGTQAGFNLTSAQHNIAIGTGAMLTATDTSKCVIIGRNAGDSINSSDSDGTVCIGFDSGQGITSGIGNTAVGFETLKTEDNGDRNTAIGYKALTTLNVSSGHGETTAVGFEAGADVSTGTMNTFVGSRAGNQGTNDITTGSSNTMIGKEARGSASSASNQTVIGASAAGQADNSVTLGNADVTDVYMAQDSGATVHANYVLSQGNQNHVANTMSSPYYRTDGVDDFLSHTNTTLLDVFTNDEDVSFEVLFKMPNTLNEQLFSYGINSSNFIQFFTIAGDLAYRTAGHGGSSLRHKVNQTLFEAGKIYHLAITMVAGSHPTIYVNGNAISFTPVNQSSDDAISNSGLQIGRGQLSSPAYGEFEFYRFKAFNLLLDATEVKELYSGASVPYKYKGANQTNLFGSLDFTSGWSAVNASITDSDTFASTSANGYLSRNFGAGDIGKQYRLRIAGTVSAGILQVQNVNGSSNILTGLSGTFDQTTEYTYAGTDDQPAIIRLTSSGATADITHFSLVRVGGVYEYDGSGIASDKWFDKSGNDKHLTVTGATVENAPSDDDGLVYDSGTWTPAFDNLTEGNATISGFYKRIGDLVYVQGEIVWGSSTSASGATAINNLPFTISNDIEPFGNAYITDSGTASYFGKVQGTVNSTTLLLQEQNSGGSGNPVSAGSITEASPFTWTTNDVFKFEITYRTA